MRSCSRFALLFVLLMSTRVVAAPPNVLFIAIDDQNDWIASLGGHPQVKTPHIDALAARGTLFANAHCQAPLCNPSRSSVLTGLRPSTTGIHGLVPGIRKVERTKAVTTLPQTYTRAGWTTLTCGKIYHDGSMTEEERAGEFQTWVKDGRTGSPPKPIAKLPGKQHPAMDWGAFPERDEDMGDYKIADTAIDALKTAPKDKPFFIACGFRLPHVPLFVPQRWLDLYPLDEVTLPPVLDSDRDDTPPFSWNLHWKLPEPRLSTLRDANEWKPIVRAYLASTSFMDAQIGRLMETLKSNGLLENTIVVIWSDHGYHMGEKLISGKNTLWEPSTHVPLLFAGPGIAENGKCTEAVELLDIYPTLLELTDQPPQPGLEGISLMPQLKEASTPRERPAITTHNQGNHSIRDDNWRYIRYADGSEELYDMKADPREWKNLASDPQHVATKAGLAKWLPKTDVPMAPGSRERILSYDPETHVATWEGKPIDPAKLER
jgi:arylsulfatase A-like enzyme